MRINQNISAMNTHSRLTQANNAKSNSLARLSSGLRINRAGDDAAGLAISEKMRGQIGGLNQAVRNAQDGISLVQTAEGALTESHSILNRMRELAVQAANDTYTDADRAEIQKEVVALRDELTRISENTQFNTKALLDGDNTFTFHVGANSNETIAVEMKDMGAAALGAITPQIQDPDGDPGDMIDGDQLDAISAINVSTQAGANDAILSIDAAIGQVSELRSDLGAVQNRLDHTINNLTVTSENLAAAESRIRDVDMAHEMMEFTKNNILSQAATSMLAQANQTPQQVLQLLQ